MGEEKMMRLSQVARQLNVGTSTILDVLGQRGFKVENSPNAKITSEQFEILAKEFKGSALEKKEASELTIGKKHNENLILDANRPERRDKTEEEEFFIPPHVSEKETPVSKEVPKETPAIQEPSTVRPDTGRITLPGVKILGKIELDKKGNPIPPKTQPQPQVEPEPIVEAKVEEVKPPVVEEKVIETPVSQPVVEKVPEVKEVEPEVQKVEPVKVEEPVKEVIPPVEATPVVVAQEVPQQQKPKEVPLPKIETKTETPIEKSIPPQPKSNPVEQSQPEERVELVKARGETLRGLSVLGKIELPLDKDKRKKGGPVGNNNPAGAASDDDKKKKKRKRKRLKSGHPENTANTADTGKPKGQPANTNNNTNTNTNNNNTNTGQSKNKPVGNNSNNNNSNNNNSNNNNSNNNRQQGNKRNKNKREEVSDREVQDQLKATLAKMGGRTPLRGKGKNRSRDNRDEMVEEVEETNILRVTEFVSVNDMASLMNVSVNDVISVCLNLGMFVSINQRLDAEAITIIADEFNYDVKFISAEEEIEGNLISNEEDAEDDLKPRAPIVTIMGHVDHGKTSLLDYIRKAKVAAGEAGGITQHIGAYDVTTESGKKITFLDTPGHEAFTAMRARGAKITDVVIIVVAADDNVMPQTKEAINHAQSAGVPIVIAINKIDKPNANPEKIREELAKENVLVEEWGGKYQSQEISAKSGKGIDELLEKVLLEAELLDLKANPKKKAVGSVIEAALDKGRGYVATVMVQAGTLKIGDILLAGAHYGRVKAMLNHKGARVKEVGPSTPVQILGLDGAPQAGEKFNVMESERDAREIANKREQILREQSIRTRRHITLDEIGRRLALDSFRELNLIVKGDVDGSVEALADSLLRLSTDEVQVRIIHKGVGQISEADVMLASASDAVIVGFQVRPSVNARKAAENEEIEIRLYSIIYDAINEVKDAMEGMLAPKVEEVIMGTIEVREVFKISKIGTVAGCYVQEGLIKRNNKIRVIRDGIVVHTGEIDALKRFKDDVNEVKFGYECGLSVKNFNDLLTGDTIESFENKETKRTL
ncbi:translation initiation factor IF-2 [Cytophagaceae bacterium YF14B1]|uniref:Translation initiation factor IF-2 n=1 Tax=Xanthocytophaga flava TaxID=3048013 RepID=A0AAE3QU38_9BACT|nr:translation initiation factor IF-2 [Xanthocytophaga flavus]MDJ1483403.1 translation initiation factor IF-2 [Xanthocytophaga flavus]